MRQAADLSWGAASKIDVENWRNVKRWSSGTSLKASDSFLLFSKWQKRPNDVQHKVPSLEAKWAGNEVEFHGTDKPWAFFFSRAKEETASGRRFGAGKRE